MGPKKQNILLSGSSCWILNECVLSSCFQNNFSLRLFSAISALISNWNSFPSCFYFWNIAGNDWEGHHDLMNNYEVYTEYLVNDLQMQTRVFDFYCFPHSPVLRTKETHNKNSVTCNIILHLNERWHHYLL